MRVTALAPAAVHRRRDRHHVGDVGGELRPHGQRAPPTVTAVDHLGGVVGGLGEHGVTAQVRTRQVHLDGHDVGRRIGQDLGGASVVIDRTAPDAGHHPCTVHDQAR